jgi:dipeptidase E
MRTLVAIGGGEIREKSTLPIDTYIASLAKEHASGNRPTAVFVGTASHDSLPYFNSFRKTYTPHFDIKADLVLLTKKDIPMEKIVSKIEKANLIYIGGGDTLFLLDVWEKSGFNKLIIDAYNRGVPCAGLSAGAICWFKDMYTDSAMVSPDSSAYALRKGLGVIDALMSPHYDERVEFDSVAKNFSLAYAVMNNSAIVFNDEKPVKTLSSGGQAYTFVNGEKSLLTLE